MLSQLAKDMFAKLDLPYSAVAVQFNFEKPEGVEHVGKTMALCSFIKEAQVTGRKFYMTADDEDCMGKMMLGMIDIPPMEGSGRAGVDFEVFKTPARNARLYHMLPRLTRDSCRYVLFCPVEICDFDPDLIICTADTRCADLLMRANAYLSGDLWESKDSHVAGCAWLFVHPFVTGKINHATVGMHHGQKVRKPYEDGLQLISIPYQKIDEIAQALSEMHWQPISVRDDPESVAELERRIKRWGELEPDLVLTHS